MLRMELDSGEGEFLVFDAFNSLIVGVDKPRFPIFG